MKDEEYYRVLDKMVNYCAYAERCLQDVYKKFRSEDIPEDQFSSMIDYLLDHDVVDEKRFALSFATGKLRYNRWGRIKIRTHLKSKNIDQVDVEFAFQQLNPEEYTDVLQQVISHKYDKLGNQTDAFAKVVRYAQSKGFELSLIYDLAKNFEENSR